MRLPNKFSNGALALGMAMAVSSCAYMRGAEPPLASSGAMGQAPQAAPSPVGISANSDYPVVLGEPYDVGGKVYKPIDSWNYDAVGYAAIDQATGASASHKTLPLPSYVEVTSLENGKTILVRVERRGPMTNTREIALGTQARQQLGVGEGTPVRVRRVNPPENERAALRSGATAPSRMATPKSLVEVLRRKLPANGSVSLANRANTPPATGGATAPASQAQGRTPIRRPITRATTTPQPAPRANPTPQPTARGRFSIQIAAFSNAGNAHRMARKVGGYVRSSGGYHRVRTGPFANRGQAEAALAKVRAAGYSDAQIVIAG